MNYFKLRHALQLVLLTLILSSCCLFDDEDEVLPPPDENWEYLVGYELFTTYSASEIRNNIEYASSEYPELSVFPDRILYGVRVYRVSYLIPYGDGELLVSGIICTPDAADDFPVISIQNGTNTIYADAPSKNSHDDVFKLLHGSAGMGFNVVMTDYPGFGVSEEVVHPYLVKAPITNSVLYLLKAAKELLDFSYVQSGYTNNLFLGGYSQGGWSTLSAFKELETSGSSDWAIQAVLCGAGPYNLMKVWDEITANDTYQRPYFFAYAINGFVAEGELPASEIDVYFNPPYNERIPTLFDGYTEPEDINAQLSTNLSELFTADFLSGYATEVEFENFRMAMDNNSIVPWAFVPPLRLYHGTADDEVPFAVSEAMYLQLEALGSNVELLPDEGVNHPDGSVRALIGAMDWFYSLK